MTNTKNVGPVEVWLTQRNIQVGCTVVREDESTYELDVSSLSMRGAQREITGHLVGQGFKPEGRWQDEIPQENDGPAECWRRFRAPV